MATETTILVVDDEKEIADLVEIYLVSDGYQVVKANDAEEGLRLLNEYEVQLVLLDIMMPGMDGLEMCAKIRETRNIPIIMLSAKSADIDKIKGLGTGADDYVTKPFNPRIELRVAAQLALDARRELQRIKGRDFGARAHHQPRQSQGLGGRQGDSPDADRI